MGVLTEVAQWAADVFKIETDTVWKGGDDGDANKQGQALANRTRWLKAQVEALAQAISNLFSASDYQKATAITADAGGTADAITAAFNPVITALSHGMTLYVRAAFANATTTPTFTPHSGTIEAKTIVKGAGAALAAGDIAGNGQWIELRYDQTLDKWVLLNPATFNQFHASLSASGYQRLPSGLIIQWGNFTYSGESSFITFPLAFPVACQSVVANIKTDNGSPTVQSYSTTGFTVSSLIAGTNSAGSNNYNFIAIGY